VTAGSVEAGAELSDDGATAELESVGAAELVGAADEAAGDVAGVVPVVLLDESPLEQAAATTPRAVRAAATASRRRPFDGVTGCLLLSGDGRGDGRCRCRSGGADRLGTRLRG